MIKRKQKEPSLLFHSILSLALQGLKCFWKELYMFPWLEEEGGEKGISENNIFKQDLVEKKRNYY